MKPPDALLTQLDVYTEEKFEDEEDVRERAQELMGRGSRGGRAHGHGRVASESEATLLDLVALAKQQEGLYPMMVDTFGHYAVLLGRDVDAYVVFSLSLSLSLTL